MKQLNFFNMCYFHIKLFYSKHTHIIDDNSTSNNLVNIKKKLRNLHKLDSINTSKFLKDENCFVQSDSVPEYDQSIILHKSSIHKNKKQLNFLKKISKIKKPDKDQEKVILTNYGIIRTDKLNPVGHQDEENECFTQDKTLKNHKIKILNNEQEYFHSIINEAATLHDEIINDKQNIEIDRYSNMTDYFENNFQKSSLVKKNIDNLETTFYEENYKNYFDKNCFDSFFDADENSYNNKINGALKDNVLGKDFVNNEMFSCNNDLIDITADHTPIIEKKIILDDEHLNILEDFVKNEKILHDNTNLISNEKINDNIFDVKIYPSLIKNDIDIVNKDEINKQSLKESNNLFDDYYFNNSKEINQNSNQMDDLNKLDSVHNSNIFYYTKNNKKHSLKKEISKKINTFSNFEINEDNTIYHHPLTQRELKNKEKIIVNIDEPKTAYDLIVKMRKEKFMSEQPNDSNDNATSLSASKWQGQLDSKGYRILKNQTKDLTTLPKEDIVSILKDRVLYQDDKILVLDKPYGLPSHGGPDIVHSIGQLLPDLCLRLNKKSQSPLLLVHRLDRDTTGIIILAKNLQSANILGAMLKENQIIKKYWAITKGIPSPTEGQIEIPIGEGRVGNRYRMELRPEYPREMRLLRNHVRNQNGSSDAVTSYRVISHHLDAALVECQLITGVKHQIRCHLAFGLNTPILGDHKYSHYNKLAPQKLPDSMLRLLGIRQETVRYLPMHLHAHSVVLQQFAEGGRNLFLTAKPPSFFNQNLKWLKLITNWKK